MEYKILKLGSFVPMNEQGYLLNNNTIAQINPPFDKPINKIIATYSEIFKNQVHSIYIRGSVARAKAIIGFSDYDCFAVLFDTPNEMQVVQLKTSTQTLVTEFDFVSNFDLYFFTLSDLLENPDFYHWKFALKIQSLCIYGNDLIQTLPNYKPNSEIIYSLFHLEKRIEKSKLKLYSFFDPTLTKYWCSWIARTFVRCGLELVIEREKNFTNELYLCYEVFSKYYPDKKNQMQAALEFAINPITNIEKTLQLIDSLGYWLVDERIKVYGR